MDDTNMWKNFHDAYKDLAANNIARSKWDEKYISNLKEIEKEINEEVEKLKKNPGLLPFTEIQNRIKSIHHNIKIAKKKAPNDMLRLHHAYIRGYYRLYQIGKEMLETLVKKLMTLQAIQTKIVCPAIRIIKIYLKIFFPLWLSDKITFLFLAYEVAILFIFLNIFEFC